MTRLERLARLRVKLATIERAKAGARVGQLDARRHQLAALAESYTPTQGIATSDLLTARARFAERLLLTGETLGSDIRAAHGEVQQAERDLHRAEKTVDRVARAAASNTRAAGRRVVRTGRGEML